MMTHFPLGTQAAPYTFPLRNELIAAISRGVLVVEAKARSGSLITAQLAIDIGRDVFAIPADISKQNSLGCNRLIQSGSAKLVLTPEDICLEYGVQIGAPAVAYTKNSIDSQIIGLL